MGRAGKSLRNRAGVGTFGCSPLQRVVFVRAIHRSVGLSPIGIFAWPTIANAPKPEFAPTEEGGQVLPLAISVASQSPRRSASTSPHMTRSIASPRDARQTTLRLRRRLAAGRTNRHTAVGVLLL